MSSIVLLDKRGRPVRDAVLLADTRGEAELAALPGALRRHIEELSGNPLSTSFSLAKLLWLAENDKQAMANAVVWVAAKDFVRSCLTGSASTDPSDAFNSLLLDPADLSWRTDLAEACGLEPSVFPPVRAGTEPAGQVSARAASLTGLAVGTPVLTGLADMASLAVGVGWLETAVPAVSLGTSTTMLLPVAPGSRPPSGFSVHPVLPGLPWFVMGSLLTGGLALDWLRRLGPLVPTRARRQTGLVFLPHLSGRGSPCFSPNWRGSLLGLDPSTDLASVAQALFDAVAFELRGWAEALGAKLDGLVITGGGSAVRPWLQAVADVLEAPVHVLEVGDATVFGAALLALEPAQARDLMERVRGATTIEPRKDWEVDLSYAHYVEARRLVGELYEPAHRRYPRRRTDDPHGTR